MTTTVLILYIVLNGSMGEARIKQPSEAACLEHVAAAKKLQGSDSFRIVHAECVVKARKLKKST